MKESSESAAVGRARDPEEFANRKLIRPTLSRDFRAPEPSTERRERAGGGPSRKLTPPEQTHAKNFYYQKQIQSRTPMVVVLNDGESVHGIIEWYDRSCIKLSRDGHSNILIYKSSIKYMFKEAEEL